MGIYKGSRRRAVRELVRAENAQTLADADRHVGLLRGARAQLNSALPRCRPVLATIYSVRVHGNAIEAYYRRGFSFICKLSD